MLVDGQIMTGTEFSNPFYYAVGCRYDGMETELKIERDRIDPGVDIAGPQQGGQGRSKPETVVIQAEIQRLDSQPVACNECLFAVAVPNRAGEHTFKTLETIRAPGKSPHQPIAV